MAIVGLVIFALSLIGYSGTLRYLGINAYLAWITAILLQILTLYVFAMLNLLRWGIWFVVGLGLILYGSRLMLISRGKGRLKFEGLHLFDVWLAGLGLAMMIVLYQSPLVHYDNFSHWALIVKFLNFTGHLPGATDTIISFSSYPPATALFINQFVSLVGFSDGTMLVAQFILIWAASYSIFAVLRDRTRGLMSLVLCFTITISYVFNIAIRLNNLLVDYVLPILTVAALVGIFVYRKKPLLLWLHTVLFSAVLLLVKNSAAFFVAVIAIYFLFILCKYTRGHWVRRSWRVLYRFTSALAISVGPFIWWQHHVHQTFTVSKHEISTQAYSHRLATEGIGKALKIGHKMVLQLLNPNSLSVQGIILINLTLIIAAILIRHGFHTENHLLRHLLLLDVMMLLYFGSLYGMYVLSMPYKEAIVLDGYERYMSSIVILCLFIGAMMLVRSMDFALYEQQFARRDLRTFHSIFTKKFYQIATFILLIFSIIMMLSEINGTNFSNHYNRNTIPLQLKRIAQPWQHYNQTKILVVDPHIGDVADYYAGFVSKYYFFSDKATAQENFNESPRQFRRQIQRYQYVAIPEYHHTFTVMMRHAYRQKSVRIGFFKVTKHGLQRIKPTATQFNANVQQ